MRDANNEVITVIIRTDEQPPRILITTEGEVPVVKVETGDNPEITLYALGKQAIGQHLYVDRVYPLSPKGRKFITRPVHPGTIPNTGYTWMETDAS